VNIDPTIQIVAGQVKYAHKKRHGDSTLNDLIQGRTNLTTGGWSTASFDSDTAVTGEDYNDVTHTVTVDHPNSYIRLKI
jgi:hypothetical protein